MSQTEIQEGTLGEQHFIVVQYILNDKQYVCVKCGLAGYQPELMLGQKCKSTLELQEPETKSYLTMCREHGYDD